MKIITCVLALLCVSADAPPGRRTEARADPAARGRFLKEQQAIAEEFARQAPEPKERLAHFSWIKGHGMRVTGWQCSIRQVARCGEGDARLVLITVGPVLETGGAATPDHFTELYEFSGGRFRFLDGEPPLGELPWQIITIN